MVCVCVCVRPRVWVWVCAHAYVHVWAWRVCGCEGVVVWVYVRGSFIHVPNMLGQFCSEMQGNGVMQCNAV